jgi:hypothetical protein
METTGSAAVGNTASVTIASAAAGKTESGTIGSAATGENVDAMTTNAAAGERETVTMTNAVIEIGATETNGAGASAAAKEIGTIDNPAGEF